jgi:lipid II:glycine glycyltransferase (peptidoglycan interpeptide bridge formation enzyme)
MQKSFMQSEFWAEFKEQNGWNVRKVKGLYVYQHALPLKKNFLYIPEISVDSNETFSSTVAHAASALSTCKLPNSIFGRAEFLQKYDEKEDSVLRNAKFYKSTDEVQPAYHQEIDLTIGYDNVVAQFKPKCRYKIRLAERHGVKIYQDNSKSTIDEFNEINIDTAKRKGFSGRNAEYITDLINVLNKHKVGDLWVARYDGKIIAGAVMIFYAGRASYVYGASRDEKREVMAPRLLHDELIKEAIRHNCVIHDFIGVAPEDAPKTHSWAGISSFKRDFGGSTVRYLGSYDRIYQALWYTSYRILRKKSQ